MRNRMYFGVRNNAEFGVIVTRLPDIPRAEEDGEWVTVSGADGERFVSNGALKSVSFAVPLWIPPETDIDAVAVWLSGEGNLRFNNWGWFWKARTEGQMNLAPCTFNDGWTTSVLFKAKPYRYIYPEAGAINVNLSGEVIKGRGTADALPLIEVTGNGNVTVMVGGSTVLIDDLNGTITLDCETKMAYNGQILMTKQTEVVNGIWPKLSTDVTTVNCTGNITSLRITPRWRCR